MLHGFDYSGFLTGGHKTLAGAANHVLGLKPRGQGQQAVRRQTPLCRCRAGHGQGLQPVLHAGRSQGLRDEVAFMQAVKVILTKRDISAQKKTDEQRDGHSPDHQPGGGQRRGGGHLRRRGAGKAQHRPAGRRVPGPGENLPERNLAVELLERLLEGEIKSKFATNVVQQKKFSDLLSNVITRYQNRSIETAQVMEELVEMAKKFKEAASRGEQLGLSDDEVKFYDALANNESAVRELTDETLKKIAHELTENLRKNMTVDWSSARACAPACA
jgi:type I restriction enzyme R subunit